MFPTALIYSSHNRCEEIHRWWIVERALRNPFNKTVFYLPMAMGADHQQEYSWGTFRWYFDMFRKWGLEARNFYWHEALAKKDVDLLFEWLMDSEVVILGGGSSLLGMQRYKALGERFYGKRHLFGDILHERQNQGKLTAGFSAGADQLCENLVGVSRHYEYEPAGFGLARNVMTTLHHEWGQEHMIQSEAYRFPHCVVFGLPNDSGIAVDQGFLPSGNIWQVIEFIVDTTWDIPADSWHIKTRAGMKIEHYYNDGRHWTFDHHDRMVRVMSPDNQYSNAWIIPAHGGPITNYWTQDYSGYHNVEHILADH